MGHFVDALRRLNSRHPWNHNDAFHPWILTRLPAAHGLAIDVAAAAANPRTARRTLRPGSGRRHRRRHATVSSARCAGLPNATVTLSDLADPPTGADLVTMIAVLHHMDLRSTLEQVARILNPRAVPLRRSRAAGIRHRPYVGRRFHDHQSDHRVRAASVAVNGTGVAAPVPGAGPELTFAEIDAGTRSIMPGAKLQHHLGFRHTIAWTKPTATIA